MTNMWVVIQVSGVVEEGRHRETGGFPQSVHFSESGAIRATRKLDEVAIQAGFERFRGRGLVFYDAGAAMTSGFYLSYVYYKVPVEGPLEALAGQAG